MIAIPLLAFVVLFCMAQARGVPEGAIVAEPSATPPQARAPDGCAHLETDEGGPSLAAQVPVARSFAVSVSPTWSATYTFHGPCNPNKLLRFETPGDAVVNPCTREFQSDLGCRLVVRFLYATEIVGACRIAVRVQAYDAEARLLVYKTVQTKDERLI